jgi:hypothetical protein
MLTRFKAIAVSLAATLILLGSSSVTSASIISGTYAITATDFLSNPPGLAPTPTVIATFTLAFDNSASIPDTTAGLIVNSLNIAVDGSVEFTYDKTKDVLIIGGSANGGAAGLGGGSANDFSAVILDVTTAPNMVFPGDFAYTVLSANPDLFQVFVAQAGTFRFTPAAIPEPASLVLFGTAVLAFGVIRRRRKKV